MIRFRFLFVAQLALLVSCSFAFAEEARETTLQLPPDSLAQWYKPVNKRQVWLHNMFSLRREMLAVSDYIALEDQPRLSKWVTRLGQHYRKIGEMVPEWREDLDLEQLDRLLGAVEQGDYSQAAAAQRKLGHSCNACHRENRALVAAIYRSPDFGAVQVEDSETLEEEPYKRVMGRLSMLLNRVKIASEDGRKQTALDSLSDLQRRLDDLGQSCNACHRDDQPKSRVLGEEMQGSLAALEGSIAAEDIQKTGRNLGMLAVHSCARCHGVHRLLNDLRREIVPSSESGR